MSSLNDKLWKAGLVTAFTTASLYGINRIIYENATCAEHLNKHIGKFYDWKYGKIFYIKQGEGSPILLIHDLSVYSSDFEWKKVYDKLCENHTVYSLDLLGCGRSQKPRISYTSYLYVQLITDFIKDIIGSNTDVIASHNSSDLVMMVNANNDSLFKKIILVNPKEINKKNFMSQKKAQIHKAIIETPIFGTFIYNLSISYFRIARYFRENYFYKESRCSKKLIHAYYESAHLGKENARYLYASITSNYLTANVKSAIKKCEKDITIIASSEIDEIEKTAAKYARYNNNVNVIWIDYVKLLPQLENPEKFVKAVNSVVEN